ncbi:MAG: succinylglutamate desuccinylase/aspartoacylase family protein [Planctomycetota bacterium]
MSNAGDASTWFGTRVDPGARVSTSLPLSQSYSGAPVRVPVCVWRGVREGPTVCVTAAVHGDEINGTGAIRHIIRERPFEIAAGTLVLVPVVNIAGFERHTRYLPDRRDLNRSFPGSPQGSAAARTAWSFFDQIIKRCAYGIDLHTAAVRRTNFPNVRADMGNATLAAFARAFGAELIVSGQGPKGSLRASACAAGCQTLILEAGEVWKVEPGVVEYATRGITNCLRFLGMVDGEPEEPPYRIETDATKWIRAEHGGFLEFHAAPGDIVRAGEPIATNTDLMGVAQNVLPAPRDGIVLGMTTIPAVAPGDPVCHLAFPSKGELKKAGRLVGGLAEDSLHQRIRDDLASNVLVTSPEEKDST